MSAAHRKFYEKSVSTLSTSSSANVSGTQLLIAATNQESSSNNSSAMSFCSC